MSGGCIHAVGRRLRRLAGRVRNKLGPRAAVLLYHRVTDDLPPGGDPYLLRVRPRHFAEHLQVIRQLARPMPLRQLVAALRAGRLPHRAVAVTFDDGYADNLYTAKPLLAAAGVPATVFMTAGSIGRRREFWWDELERLVLGTAVLPPRLELPCGTWDLSGPTPDQTAAAEGEWNLALPPGQDRTPRHRLLRELHRALHPMGHEPRERMLDRIAAWVGTGSTQPIVRPTHRALEPAEVPQLADGGLVEIGAHTMTHPSLPAQSEAAQRDEITSSKRRIEDIICSPVTSFAYPYGDHSDQTVAAVREAGIETACACLDRIVTPRSEPLRLPRMDVMDWDGDTFARHLGKWLRG